MNKITPEFMSQWEALSNETGKMEEQIITRIDYIIRTYFKIFDGNVDYWYFEGAEENQEKNLIECIYNDFINSIFLMEKPSSKSNSLCFIDKNGNIECWSSRIPTRWLYEDFEGEIIIGKRLYEDKMAAKKEKAKLSKAQKAIKTSELVETAKAKLTTEELKALKQAM